MIEEIPDDGEWKNQTINSINDDMDLLISYINGDTDRNVWINAKSTMATEIQAEINLKKKSYHWKNKSQRNSMMFSQRKGQPIFQNQDPGTTKSN